MSNFLDNLRNPQSYINGGIGCLVAGGAMWLVGMTSAVAVVIAGVIVLGIGIVMKMSR